jgi:hypothetical protein
MRENLKDGRLGAPPDGRLAGSRTVRREMDAQPLDGLKATLEGSRQVARFHAGVQQRGGLARRELLA